MITKERLLQGEQPTSLEEYLGQAIGAASTIQFGPGITEPFDEQSARNILEWAADGIRALGTVKV